MLKTVEVHRTAAGVLYWRDECFWHFINEPNYELVAADTEQFIKVGLPFIGGKKAPLLLDRRHSYSPTLSALQLLSKRAPELFTAIAYYAPSFESAKAAAFVRDVFLGDLPVKIFATEDEAVRWLHTLVKG